MDLLYTLKNNDYNPEFQYSLRSAVKNLSFDKLFIVGGCPSILDKSKIVYIKTPTFPLKYETTSNNLFVACSDPRLSDNFILMNDDFFLLKRISNPVKEFNLNFGTVEEVIHRYKVAFNGKESKYLRGMIEALEYFRNDLKIMNPISYELHTPMIINKANFLELLKLPNNTTPAFHMNKRSIYGNLFMKDSVKINDVKIYGNSNFYSYSLKDKKMISSSDNSWKSKLKNYIPQLFKEKSPYEL
jgi:hypothetical protein